jgi:protein-L-isoaspartate(D-aspartate) O-methyltransferase
MMPSSVKNPLRDPDDAYTVPRFNMVEGQIRTNRVTDERLLATLSAIPRELFVPPALASVAYVDTSLRLAGHRYLMEPLFLARLIQSAGVDETDAVLVIGAGTGYSAAVLAHVAQTVIAVENDAVLVDAARRNMKALGLANVVVESGDLCAGWASGGPYDVILIDGMVAAVPDAIVAQLADHGRLVTIQALEGCCGAGMLFRKLGGVVSGRALFDATSPFLPGFEPAAAFSL